MLVDVCMYQLFGLLYGGVFVVLVEMLGLMVGWLMIEEGQCVVGIEFNVSYYWVVFSGKVCGECCLLYFGCQSQSWEIVVYDEKGWCCCICCLGIVVLG